MIIVRITSGLGNQLFQYAAARSLAFRHNTVIKIDKIGFATDKQRKFALDCFDINIVDTSIFDLVKLYPLEGIVFLLLRPFTGKKNAYKLILWFEQKCRNLQKHYNQPSAHLQPLVRNNLLVQRFYHFDEEILKAPDNIYMIGYFQSWKYFNNIRPLLLKELQFREPAVGKNKELLERITNLESVAIHVRRGDYFIDPANRKLFEVYDLQYFEQAIQIIKTKINHPLFFVFSDDFEWVQKNLISDETLIFVGTYNTDRPAEDLRLMSNCKHCIISNSSFSWWGAWLNQNPDKIIIAPKKWLNAEEYDTSDLLPDEWIKI